MRTFRKSGKPSKLPADPRTRLPPDLDKFKARPRQNLEVINEDLDIGILEEAPERPDEQSLKRVPDHALLPQESTSMVPLDFQMDYTLPEFVREQRIEPAVACKPPLARDLRSYQGSRRGRDPGCVFVVLGGKINRNCPRDAINDQSRPLY